MTEAQATQLLALLTRIVVALESQGKVAVSTNGALMGIQTSVQSIANQGMTRH
jgi:hypothetical protein